MHVAIASADIAVWLEPHINILKSLLEPDPETPKGENDAGGIDVIPILSALQFFCRISPLMKTLVSWLILRIIIHNHLDDLVNQGWLVVFPISRSTPNCIQRVCPVMGKRKMMARIWKISKQLLAKLWKPSIVSMVLQKISCEESWIRLTIFSSRNLGRYTTGREDDEPFEQFITRCFNLDPNGKASESRGRGWCSIQCRLHRDSRRHCRFGCL